MFSFRPKGAVIETERLILQPIGPLALARRTYRWTRQAEIFTYIGMRTGGWTFRRYYRDLRSRARRPGTEMRAIVEKASNEIIGFHCIQVVSGIATLIIVFPKEHWGRGLQREISRPVIDHCFQALDVAKISAVIAAQNRAAAKNTERSGYQLEGRLRMEFPLHDGTLDDKLIYGLTRADWQALPGPTP